jgi:hypothetical protein
MTLLQWIRKWDLQNDSITGRKDDMLSFANFVERNADKNLEPKLMVKIFNDWRPFMYRIDYKETS